MVECGILLVCIMFVFNLVNVEGWVLYVEVEMVLYELLDG